MDEGLVDFDDVGFNDAVSELHPGGHRWGSRNPHDEDTEPSTTWVLHTSTVSVVLTVLLRVPVKQLLLTFSRMSDDEVLLSRGIRPLNILSVRSRVLSVGSCNQLAGNVPLSLLLEMERRLIFEKFDHLTGSVPCSEFDDRIKES